MCFGKSVGTGELCKQGRAGWQHKPLRVHCSLHLIWGCMLQAPRSTLSTLIQKAGPERPGLKTRLMVQRSRNICHVSGH